MPVQDERRRLPAAAGCLDRVDGLARPGDVVPDPHGSVAVAIAVDQCSGICQYPSSLRQRERTETQASAIATLEQIAPGRLMVGFGTGFTGRAGMGKKPLSLASMRTHIAQVKALLRGDIADIDGGLAQILASDGWLPDRPIKVPFYMAGQGPKARALAKEITDGLISLGGPAEGFETCLVSTGGTVLDDSEDVTSPRASTAVKPLVALAYHSRYTADPESVKALPKGEAWLASVERVDENVRHLSIHRGHNLDISNGHDALVDVSAAKQMTFTGTREELRERLVQLEARGATGIIFGTSGYDVERELRAYAEVAGLR